MNNFQQNETNNTYETWHDLWMSPQLISWSFLFFPATGFELLRCLERELESLIKDPWASSKKNIEILMDLFGTSVRYRIVPSIPNMSELSEIGRFFYSSRKKKRMEPSFAKEVTHQFRLEMPRRPHGGKCHLAAGPT